MKNQFMELLKEEFVLKGEYKGFNIYLKHESK